MKIATKGKNMTRPTRDPAPAKTKMKLAGGRKLPAARQTGKMATAKGPREGPSVETATGAIPAAKPMPRRLQPVHFELRNPSARKVCIAGTFNDWQPEAAEMISLGSGKWAKDLTLPPGTYEYRLVVDGKWMPDPNASRTVPNPFGEPNSVLTVPSQSAPPTPPRRTVG